MKLPVNAFLYLVSTGLLGGAGYTFYRTFPDQTTEARMVRHNNGLKEARDLLSKAKDPQARSDRTWNYAGKWWKDGFMAANVLGKEKPKDPTGGPDPTKPVAPTTTTQPLADIIELVTVMYGASAPGDPNLGKYDPSSGKGDRSHVIVRYKGQVTPPDWYQRENQPVTSSSSAPAGPGDSVAATQSGAPARGPQRGGVRGGAGPRPATPMPGANASTAGAEILQRVWVAGDGTPHFENMLWAPYSDIKLVRVDPDSRYAVFVRVPPPPKAGEKPVEPAEEQLFQTSVPMSQEMAKAMYEILRQPDPTQKKNDKPAVVESGQWIDTNDGTTQKINGAYQVGRKDRDMFGGDAKFFEQNVNAESYVSKSVRGLMIKNVNSQIASRFGISAGEVVIAVNGESVETRADAMATGKRQYDRGTRTFVVTFLSNGQRIDRSYQMPPR
jgi:hypothetical protein